MKHAVTVLAALLVAASLGWAAGTPVEEKEVGSREQVKEAQQALKDHGLDPGPIDGIMGPRTTAAVRDFQLSEGLPETGRLDAETMAKLGATTPGQEGREQAPHQGMEQPPHEQKSY